MGTDTPDIVQRLNEVDDTFKRDELIALCLEAADEITRLRSGTEALEKRVIMTMDQIGRDWRDAGDMQKFYATNYLIEQVRAALSAQGGEKS